MFDIIREMNNDWDWILPTTIILSVITTIILIIYTPLRWYTIFWLPLVMVIVVQIIATISYKSHKEKFDVMRDMNNSWSWILPTTIILFVIATIILVIYTSLHWYTIVWLPIVMVIISQILATIIYKSHEEKKVEKRKKEIHEKLKGLTKEQIEQRKLYIEHLKEDERLNRQNDWGYSEYEDFELLEYNDSLERYKNSVKKREEQERRQKEINEKAERRYKENQEELKNLTKEEQKERKKCIAYLVVNEFGEREHFESLGYHDLLELYKKTVREEELKDKLMESNLRVAEQERLSEIRYEEQNHQQHDYEEESYGQNDYEDESYEEDYEEEKPSKSRKSIIGETILFVPANIEVEVASDDNEVRYQGEIYTLNSFIKKFIPKDQRAPSGSYKSSLFFKYQDETLFERRKRMRK